MPLLSQQALSGLSTYSYKSIDKSILSKYVLNPFWNEFVKLWPPWVAPNTITLCGLSFVLFNVLTLIYYDPSYLSGSSGMLTVPKWLYYSWALGLFFYQTFDAIDGKQARRTGMASPLGEMFDHGCDALNTTLEVILVAHALNLGRSRWTIAIEVTSLATFYLTTWEEYYTGQLFLGVVSGPVEGIIMVIFVYVVSGYYGPAIWDETISSITSIDGSSVDFLDMLLSLRLNEIFLLCGAAGLLFNISFSCWNVFQASKLKGKPFLGPLFNLAPFIITTTLHLLWLYAPSFGNLSILESPLIIPFLFSWGLQFAHQVGRMILAHVTSQPFPRYNPTWLWMTGVALDANASWIFGSPPRFHASWKDTQVIVYLTLVISLVVYVRFVLLVIQEVMAHLGIACFTAKKRSKTGAWLATTTIKEKSC